MEFSEVVRRRRMVRRYDPDRPVPREVIERCLANAVRAPSAGFSQGWDFLVLSSPAERDMFWAATTEEGGEPDRWLSGIQSAPVLVVCLSHKNAYLDRPLTRASPTETRPAGRCPTGTSTPAWPRC